MRRIMRSRHEQGLEPDYDPTNPNQFERSWVMRYKKTKGIKRRRQTNKTDAILWERRPKMQKNLRFCIYRLQNPELMSQKYMALSAILKRKTTKDCIDNADPEKIIQ